MRALRPQLRTRMNLECAVTQEMLDIACDIGPQDVCLVPERRQEVTTEGGLDVVGGFAKVQAACQQLAGAGIRVSLFIDPDPAQIEAAAATGAPVVELHTGRYAEATDDAEVKAELVRIERAVEEGIRWGCASMPGTACTTPTCSRSRRWRASTNSTSATPSSRMPCLPAGRTRCAR